MQEDTDRRKRLMFGVVAVFTILSYLAGYNLCLQFVYFTLLLLLVTNKRYVWIDITYQTIGRDLLAAVRFVKMNYKILRWEMGSMSVVQIFQQICKKHPDKIAYCFQDEKWTFRQIDEYTDKIGSYFMRQGYTRGETVALYMENRVEYVCFWLGLSKIGVVTALINTNLRDKPLLHSISSANSRGLIYSAELKKGVEEVKAELSDLKLYEFGNGQDESDLKKQIEQTPVTSLASEIAKGNHKDKLMYIYTSGTTGLPKAAIIPNIRFTFMSSGTGTMLGIDSDDVIYESLPMYHTTGGILGIGQALLQGSTVVIRKKFSASNYWTDCIKYNCTVGIYIGEICRYLLSTPAKDTDTRHNVRLMFGNGLRKQIWKDFVDRFQVKNIGELYGATEGNSNLANIDGKIGAVGFVPRIASLLYPVALIKVDPQTEEPIRGQDGLCIRSEVGEPGMFIGKITPKRATGAFAGYADRKASEKKILNNVFKQGDQYFNSGDVLVMDEYGYFYFRDRTGDTFRWKGENVSTSEVEAVISNLIGLKDSVVYGVEVPNTEGKAGMVAICDPNKTINLKKLEEGLMKSLPAFARPVFLRILDELPMTGTFKLKKKDLQNEGFNPNLIQDPLYLFDPVKQEFVDINDEVYDRIMNGIVRL